VTVTDAECVTGTDVTDADDVSHALSVPTSRTQNPDVTHATPPYKSFEPSGEKSSLSSSGAPNPAPPEPPAAPEEREKFATPKDKPATTAQRIVRSAQVLKDTEVDPFIAWATAKHNVRSPAWWRTVADDLPELVSAWRADPAQQRASLPPWCGQCGAGNPAAQGNPRFRTANDDGSGGKCPNCHPDMVAA
jgi:hypothetical protein